jgi:hypothetical protein
MLARLKRLILMKEGLYLFAASSLQGCQAFFFFAVNVPITVIFFCSKNSAVGTDVKKLSVVTPLT